MEMKRWEVCEKDEEIAAAKETCAEILKVAGQVLQSDQDRGKKLVSDAVAAHNLNRIKAMLKLSISEPDMAVTDRELDADPMKLGVDNGVVDLKTGHLLFNRAEMLITKFCNASFEPDEPCPRWMTFLNEIFESDDETIESVQRLLGYTLTGLSTEEILVICYGFGSNGKSVFSNVVHKILGGYSKIAASSLLIARRKDDAGPRNDLAALAGSRYVALNELPAGSPLDEQIVKLMAGREPISARFLNQEFFEFQPTFTPWLRTNHKPIIRGDDDGIWRRLILVPFRHKFEEHEKDRDLEQKLWAERDGILRWMLEGTQIYLKYGLKHSPRMKSEILTYRNDSDMLGEFLEEETRAKADVKIKQYLLFAAWKDWCERNEVRCGSKKSFTQRLAERGFRDSKSGDDRFYLGLEKRAL
jgi:putative DNA primase/helicase